LDSRQTSLPRPAGGCGRVDYRGVAGIVMFAIYGLCALVSLAGSLLLAYWVLIKVIEYVISRRMW